MDAFAFGLQGVNPLDDCAVHRFARAADRPARMRRGPGHRHGEEPAVGRFLAVAVGVDRPEVLDEDLVAGGVEAQQDEGGLGVADGVASV